MLLEIDHRSGVPIYRQLMDQVRQAVLTGRLGLGDQLPPVRDVAARLMINPMTVSKAYALLEAEGLLERRRGVGLFVARVEQERMERAKAGALKDLLTKAATAAVELGIPEEEAADLFADLYREYEARKGANVK